MPTSSDSSYPQNPAPQALTLKEQGIEEGFIEKLRSLKYTYRPDIRDRAALEKNFREKFEALNRVRLTDGEFQRLLDELITPDVFTAARVIREKNDFIRDDGTPLAYTLVNIKDWCKNDFEVIHQLRINTDYSHHRYDVILLINGVPVAQVELKTLGVNPRRAMEQIVEYKNDPGNGYTRTLLCFIQLFIVSNRTDTIYFANNNARHFAFNADERFLPVYRFADKDNKPISHLDDFADRFLQKCELGRMVIRQLTVYAELARRNYTQAPGKVSLALLYPFVGADSQCLPDHAKAWNDSDLWLVPVRVVRQTNPVNIVPPLVEHSQPQLHARV